MEIGPVPGGGLFDEAATLAALNQVLLTGCDQLAGADHWRKGAPIGELFA